MSYLLDLDEFTVIDDILNELINNKEIKIIDLSNKTYKCKKTININRNNLIIQNGKIDFTELNDIDTSYSESITNITLMSGIRIKGNLETFNKCYNNIKKNSSNYNDYIIIDKNNNIKDKDYIYIMSDFNYGFGGGGGNINNPIQNGEIIQVDTVDYEQWEKLDYNSNNSNYNGDIIIIPNTNQSKINLINSSFDNYFVEDNFRFAKINFVENIKFINLVLIHKKLTVYEMNQTSLRLRAHRTEERIKNNLINSNLYLGNCFFIQYGKNIYFDNCYIINWYDSGIIICSSKNIDIVGCTIDTVQSNGKGYGINIRDASLDINIRYCKIQDTRHSISIGGLNGISRNIIIDSNTISKSRDAGIDSHASGFNLNIINNNIICENSDGESDGIIIEGSSSFINNNNIRGYVYNGICIKPLINIKDTISNFIITNNIIDGNRSNNTSSAILINTNSTVEINKSNVIISNNSIVGKYLNGIKIYDNIINNLSSILINSNIINECKKLQINNVSRLSLINNHFNNINLEINNVKNSIIKDNILDLNNFNFILKNSNIVQINNNNIIFNITEKLSLLNIINSSNINFNDNNIIGNFNSNDKNNILKIVNSNNIFIKNNNMEIDNFYENLLTHILISNLLLDDNIIITDNLIKNKNKKARYNIYNTIQNPTHKIYNNIFKNL